MSIRTVQKRDLPGAHLARQLTALAVPVAGTQLAQIALSATDTAMMGLLGVEALAGGGLAVVIFNQLRTMGVGLLVPMGNQIAAADTAADPGDAARAIRGHVRAGFLLATIAGIIGALAIIGIGWLLPFLGQSDDVVTAARSMLVALAPGLIPCLWFQVIRQFTVGMRKPLALLWITVASVAVNAALNLGFIHGWGPFPSLGLAGIGLSTSLVHALTFIVFWILVRRNQTLSPLMSVRFWRAERRDVISLLGLGVPVSATYASEAGMFSVLALVMGAISAEALAAHNIVYQITFIVFQVAIGLSQGASILVSRQVARMRTHQALTVMRLALAATSVLAAASGLCYLFIPDVVLAPFTVDASSDTIALCRSLLLIGIVMQFVDAAQNVGVGLLRGLGDTVSAFRLSVVGYWLVGLPTALVLAFPVGLDAAGVWWGLTCGLGVTAALMLMRFVRSVPRTSELSPDRNGPR
ncbi:MATE family efflux transporter [Gordonia insulae]|uniref:Probable multidrug resistance protein NorM n=1 Tax=Gordonia insulae TaxID=2420509 RepID=A0A3G8JME6_9ACTN|nr:MATE family efflux transporter [Gordonia insulae]AZG46251.1 Multidrug resistance protein MdtK [Gordonia insulae]